MICRGSAIDRLCNTPEAVVRLGDPILRKSATMNLLQNIMAVLRQKWTPQRRSSARRQTRLSRLEPLESRRLLAAAFTEFVDPNPAAGNQFGSTVVALSTGNVVITSPYDDAGGTDAGAAYLFNGATGALISTLTGSHADDNVGSGVIDLGNGNFVILSAFWDDGIATDVGAVTWGSGVTGVSGIVSAANSFVGSTADDLVGDGGIVVLTNGNYVISSPTWDDGLTADVGAVTWGNGATGSAGVVSSANSLIGSTAFDSVGDGIFMLTNGNYVVTSEAWDNGVAIDAGAVTWANGTTGLAGVVSTTNSLVGSTTDDQIGNNGVAALSNGNYVVQSQDWDRGAIVDAGAITFADGTTGITGAITDTNSLVGSTAGDRLSNGGLFKLTNGNFVLCNSRWDNGPIVDAGAVTLVSGTTGITGMISAANSLVGDSANDDIGVGGITVLNNGNYVIRSPKWDDGVTINAGAVTWANGTTGITGFIDNTNSLVGVTAEDNVGFYGVASLSNGHYVINSPFFDDATNSRIDVGAVTWGNGAGGTVGTVSAANSLIGSHADDQVGVGSITPLTNGHYVVSSPYWDNDTVVDAGAATWLNGTAPFSGEISATNSLVGTQMDDLVSLYGVTDLANGNYVVISPNWDDATGPVTNVGAVTWGNGATGTSGAVSSTNSLVGSTAEDRVGLGGVTALPFGDYVVSSYYWDNATAANAGAVTFGDKLAGITGAVSEANSRVGSTTDDTVGIGSITVLQHSYYAVLNQSWDNGALVDAGAMTFSLAGNGDAGTIDGTNSALGLADFSGLQFPIVVDDVNNTFMGSFINEGGGHVRVGSQDSGFANVAPTAVTLQNTTTSLAENTSTATRIMVADIVVTDDALGINTLSLVGTDADSFEIDGGVLYLKAGTTLNFESQNSYSVTVSVDDSTVGSTPDATVDFTLTVTDVNELPVIGGAVANQPVNDNATIAPFASLTVTDPDTQAMSVIVRISNGVVRGDFTAASTAGWTQTLIGNNIQYFRTYSPAANIGDTVQAAVRALVFQPRSNAINSSTFEVTGFTVTVGDGVATPVSNTATTVVTTSLNDAPAISGANANVSVNDTSTTNPFSALTVTDPDTQKMLAKVTVLNGAYRGDFTAASTVGWTRTVIGNSFVYSRFYSPQTNIGAVVQVDIRTLVFQPRVDAIDPGSTEATAFAVFINDGIANMADGTTTVITTSLENAPTIGGAVANQAVSDDATIAPFTTLTITDIDTQNMLAKVTISNGVNRGDFTTASTAGWTRTVTGNNITYHRYYSSTASIGATVQSAIRAFVFQPRNNVPIGTTETTQFTVFVNDGIVNIANTQTTVITTGVAPRPAVAARVLPPSILDDDTTTVLIPRFTKPRTNRLTLLLKKVR